MSLDPIRARITQALRPGGLQSLVVGALHRVIARPLPMYAQAAHLCAGKLGIEVGGPSAMFGRRRILPLYPVVASLDNCNFGAETIWEGRIAEGWTFSFDRGHAPGYQYLREATDLTGIEDCRYDFLLSSHCIEHIANPLRALREWQRVLRPGGALILAVPHKDETFDRRRPVTPVAHLREDETREVSEDDVTHLDEVVALTDPVGSGPADRGAAEQNLRRRMIHHHVFVTRVVLQMLDEVGLQIQAIDFSRRHATVFALARRCRPDQRPDNASYLETTAEHRRRSPFHGDRD